MLKISILLNEFLSNVFSNLLKASLFGSKDFIFKFLNFFAK